MKINIINELKKVEKSGSIKNFNLKEFLEKLHQKYPNKQYFF